MHKPRYIFIEKDDGSYIVIPEPRSTNEIFITEQSKGSMPCNERSTLTFPLVTAGSSISALRSIYGAMDKKTENIIRDTIRH
jgi:hypothetical protein